ncbi:lysine N(6)-hydroxylase/L-ornithine N(5)-oxygenase family protein [Streptomyces niveus]|uniref:lysine N(6)-hydroxylase/L-ornithine N(5)-oxygenase family protein n=1 Tax=Streptomyces niveus TaxID=193462 RepID=UPI00365AC9FD
MTESPTPVYDLVGVGIGPFNLSLAALAHGAPDLRTLFLDAKPAFSWHPGLLMEGTTLQVPFLADLVTMVDPTSPWSYLNYLRHHDRMFPFFFSERFHIPRREYDAYCRWVSDALPSCQFDAYVERLGWDEERDLFVVTRRAADGTRTRVLARQIVLGVGTNPVVPKALRPLLADGSHAGRVLHSADYRTHRARLAACDDVTVIGAGQSGAEVALDLLRHQDGEGAGGPYVRWLARTNAFAPMEYSKIGLEHFTPDYIRYFRALPEARREQLVAEQWQLGVAVVDAEASGDGLTLTCRHMQQDTLFEIRTSAIVSATGYAASRPAFLDGPDGLGTLVDWDEKGRYRIDGDYRVTLDPQISGRLYVQNAELHTHGVGAPDLTLGAWRAATILNAVAGRTVLRVPQRTAWTTFGAPRAAAKVPTPARTAPSEETQR